MRDHHEQDKRLTWRSKRVLATGLGLALFAMTLAVAVHTGRWNAQVAPTAASVAGIDARARLSGLDATLPGRSVAAAVSPPGAIVSASEAPASAGQGNGDSMPPDALQAVGLSPAGFGAGILPAGLETAHVGMLAMAGHGGMAYVGGTGFGYGYPGPGGGSAGGAGAGGSGHAAVGGGGGGDNGGGRNLSSANGSSDDSGRDADLEAGAGDDNPEGDGESHGHSGETGSSGNNAGGNSANGNNAGGNSTNDNNAGGSSANGNNAGGNSANGHNAGGNNAGGGSQDPLAFAGSALAALPGALTPLDAGDTGESGFGSAAGETGQVEVPEPATLGMLAFGLAGLGLARRRRASA